MEDIKLTWISEKMGISCERLEVLLSGNVFGPPEERLVKGMDFFQWFFRYRPEVITDSFHAFWMECNDILFNAFQGAGKLRDIDTRSEN